MVRPTIDSVAAEAGVSSATVSRVVSKASGVRESTRRHVQTVIDRLGYEPDHAARALRNRRSASYDPRGRTIAVLLPSQIDPWVNGFIDEVLTRSLAADLTTIAIPLPDEASAPLVGAILGRERPIGLLCATRQSLPSALLTALQARLDVVEADSVEGDGRRAGTVALHRLLSQHRARA